MMRMSRLAVQLLVLAVLATAARTAWGEVIVRVSPKEHVKDLEKVGEEIWIATENGVSRLEGHSAKAVLTGRLALTIADVHGEVWAGTQDGVFRYQDGQMMPLVAEEAGDVFVNAILAVGNTVWLGAREGLYHVDSTDSESFGDAFSTPMVSQGKEIRGVLDIKAVRTPAGETFTWVAAAGNVFQIDAAGSGSAVLGPDIDGYVSEIIPIDDSVWLTTIDRSESYGAAIRVREGGDVEKVGGVVSSVAKVRDDIWLATNKGVFIYREGRDPEGPVDGKGEAFNAIAMAGDTVWLGTREKIYRRADEGDFQVFPEYGDFNVKRIVSMGDDLWFLTNSGILRLDEDVMITAQLSFLVPLVLGEQVEIRSIRYDKGGIDPYSGEVAPRFEAIFHSDWEGYKSAVEDEQYGEYQSLRVGVKAFLPDELHLKVRDAFGNSRSFSRYVFAIPIYVVYIVFLWLLFIGIFVISPWSNFAMFILMMPPLRRFGSAFAIPLLLYFGACRRHLLSRYRRVLLEDDSIASGGYLLRPDWDTAFSEGEKFLIVDGEVSSLLKGLVRWLAKGSVSRFGRRVPVLLSLRLHANKPDGVALGLARRLRSVGKISDLKLGVVLVGRYSQDFVYIFDEWDEINDSQRLELERFIDDLPSGSMVIVGASSEVSPLRESKTVRGDEIRRTPIDTSRTRPASDDIRESDPGSR